MEKAILLAIAASFCTATASVCQRRGAKNDDVTGFDVGLFLRLASPSGGRLHAPGSWWWLTGLATFGIVLLALAVAFGPGHRPGASRARQAALLGAATGISWGFVAAVIKELSSHLGDGIGALLRELTSRPGHVISRSDLLKATPSEGGDEHAVEVAVGRLRTALGDQRIIQTVVKRGYRLAYEPERAENCTGGWRY